MTQSFSSLSLSPNEEEVVQIQVSLWVLFKSRRKRGNRVRNRSCKTSSNSRWKNKSEEQRKLKEEELKEELRVKKEREKMEEEFKMEEQKKKAKVQEVI
jgi:hypothetical protein